MQVKDIKEAVDNGYQVHWANDGYRVICDDLGGYLIQHYTGDCIGLTWRDGETLNGQPEQFYIGD